MSSTPSHRANGCTTDEGNGKGRLPGRSVRQSPGALVTAPNNLLYVYTLYTYLQESEVAFLFR